MKLKILFPLWLLVFTTAFTTNAQNRNPYKELGKKGETLTLSRGQFDEFFDEEDVQQIGTNLVNIRTMKVVKMLTEEESESRLDNTVGKRFLSVDPLAKSFAWYSPYQFAGNKPIIAIDMDGLEEVIRINTYAEGKVSTQIIRTTDTKIAQEATRLWADVTGNRSAKENKFTSSNSFMNREGLNKYSNQDAWYGGPPQTGQLTIDVDKGGPYKYQFSFSETITRDATYKKSAQEYGTAYKFDAAYIGPKILSETGKWAQRGGMAATVAFQPEIAAPLYGVGSALSNFGDFGESALDAFLANRKDIARKKIGLMSLSIILSKGLELPGKLLPDKTYKDKARVFDFMISEGTGAIKERSTPENYKPSREQISNESIKALQNL